MDSNIIDEGTNSNEKNLSNNHEVFTFEMNNIELGYKQCIMSPDLALPVTPRCLVSRSQAALNLLSCLDTITSSPTET